MPLIERIEGPMKTVTVNESEKLKSSTNWNHSKVNRLMFIEFVHFYLRLTTCHLAN